LLAYLSRTDLKRLWAAARAKLERLGRIGGEAILADSTDAERLAIANLLGLKALPRGPKGTVKVPLAALDAALRASRFAVDLPEAMALLGPLRDLPSERRAEGERREGIWRRAREHPAVAGSGRPALGPWLDDLARSGLLHRLAPAEEAAVLERTLAVLSALLGASADPAPLAVAANRALGSSHALDLGQPVATLTLGALAHLRGEPPPRTAQERRALWESAGLIADDLSCNVLALGLRPAGDGPLAGSLRALADLGEPAVLTLRQLTRGDLSFSPLPRVRVCENPAVIAAAADRFGAAYPPLVCVAGILNQAAWTLLSRLAEQGAEIAYHGDFDGPGIAIANSIARRFPTFRPWRFGASDYRAALPRAGSPLSPGVLPAASWDADLAPAMVEAGVMVEEEAVLGELLGDLEAWGL
jgi:uncharacterized protein (TIGR02679 family)